MTQIGNSDYYKEQIDNELAFAKQSDIERIKLLEKKIAPDKEWHQYSQAEANAMKNYNQALKDVLKIICEK